MTDSPSPVRAICSWCGIEHGGGSEYCHGAATHPNGEVDPRFCITCGRLLDHRSQDWFWHGDMSNPEHFECRRLRLNL